MAKSTAIPTNRMPKPTDTRFSVPTAAAANSSVSIRPSTRVSRIGTISRQVCTARNSHSVISTTLPIRPTTAPCATVANSSSASATWPVMRTRAAPDLTNSSLRVTLAHRRGRLPAGLQRAEIQLRLGQHERYFRRGRSAPPPSSACQDSGCGWPASALRHCLVEGLQRRR